jgi:hypothetical protein
MATYDYLYLLDLENSKVYLFLSCFVQEKISWPHKAPKIWTKKTEKMTIFKANFRLAKIVIVQKSYLLTIFGPLSVRKCQNLGVYWFSRV